MSPCHDRSQRGQWEECRLPGSPLTSVEHIHMCGGRQTRGAPQTVPARDRAPLTKKKRLSTETWTVSGLQQTQQRKPRPGQADTYLHNEEPNSPPLPPGPSLPSSSNQRKIAFHLNFWDHVRLPAGLCITFEQNDRFLPVSPANMLRCSWAWQITDCPITKKKKRSGD